MMIFHSYLSLLEGMWDMTPFGYHVSTDSAEEHTQIQQWIRLLKLAGMAETNVALLRWPIWACLKNK